MMTARVITTIHEPGHRFARPGNETSASEAVYSSDDPCGHHGGGGRFHGAVSLNCRVMWRNAGHHGGGGRLHGAGVIIVSLACSTVPCPVAYQPSIHAPALPAQPRPH